MKRISKISPKVQKKIIEELRQKLPYGGSFYSLKEVAKLNCVSLTAVNTIARHARIWRSRRAPKLRAPPAWVLKILRDYTEPHITLAEVGRRNPRIINGKPRPRSKQRIKQIVDFWKKRSKSLDVRRRNFLPGDIIEWDGRHFIVTRYDDEHRGAVKEISDGVIIDPFHWNHDEMRSKLVRSADGSILAAVEE